MVNLAAHTRRRFFAICEKPEGGGVDIRPPGRARVIPTYLRKSIYLAESENNYPIFSR